MIPERNFNPGGFFLLPGLFKYMAGLPLLLACAGGDFTFRGFYIMMNLVFEWDPEKSR